MVEETGSNGANLGSMNSSGYSNWDIQTGSVRLVNPSDQSITPTALEILGAEKKGLREIQGHIVAGPPSEALKGLSLSRFPVHPKLLVTTPSEENKFRGTWKIRTSGSERDFDLSVQDISTGHVMCGKDWYPIESGDLEEVRSLIREQALSETGNLSIGQYLELAKMVGTGPVRLGESEVWEEYCGDTTGTKILGDFPGLVISPYSYQASGIEWLRGLAREKLGGILADEMGLGKTLQVIALFAAELAEGRKQHLVVAPVSLLENWSREIRKFAPSMKPLLHQGVGRTGFPNDLVGHDIVLTSYDTVLRDNSLFGMIDWGIVVLDEAQAIKNPDAKRTKSVKGVRRRVGIAVTGTPVENRLRDLWSLMDFAVPGYLGTVADFSASFEDSVVDAENLEPLITPLMLRRRVTEVAKDLPERIDIPQIITLSERESEEYERIRIATLEEYGGAAALVNLIRLRMFCANPRLSGGSEGVVVPSTKLVRLLEIIEEIFERKEKVLVFTSFTEAADMICNAVRARFGIRAETLDGRRAVSDRQALVDRLGSEANLGCLVLNPKAAGTGLNITSANHVVHFNPEWNPATEDQSTARSYRRGQIRPVTVHRLIAVGTVEEVILDRLERKRELANIAVVGVEGNGFEREDIMKALTLSPLIGGTNSWKS